MGKRKEMFMTRRRLRKCRRCGHFPCPHCVVWCDVIHVEKKEIPMEPPLGSNIDPRTWKQILETLRERPVDEQNDPDPNEPECPCFADDQQCLMSYDDWECNKEVFEIFESLCKEMEAQGITINGDTTTEDGRIIGISDP